MTDRVSAYESHASREIRLVDFDRTYLERSWKWLRDPEIKRLTLAADFTREEQERFFASLPNRGDYRVWGVETLTGKPLGAAGIKHIHGRTGEFWCYIGERNFWGVGLGPVILRLCEEKAAELGLLELIMLASDENQRSIRSFEKVGFQADEAYKEKGIVRLRKVLI